MLSGEFERKLRQLNPDIRIFCGDDDTKAAGVFRTIRDTSGLPNGDYQELCGCDKNWVPERTEIDETGKILRGGWRRVLRILITKHLVDRKAAERVFATNDLYRPAKPRIIFSRAPKNEMIRRYAVGV